MLGRMEGMWGRIRGVGADRGVWGGTEDVRANGGVLSRQRREGGALLQKGHNALLSSFFYFECSNHVLLTDCGRAGCSGGGWFL